MCVCARVRADLPALARVRAVSRVRAGWFARVHSILGVRAGACGWVGGWVWVWVWVGERERKGSDHPRHLFDQSLRRADGSAAHAGSRDIRRLGRLQLLTFVDIYICLHSFTFVCIRLHLFTFVCICLHSFTFVYIRPAV